MRTDDQLSTPRIVSQLSLVLGPDGGHSFPLQGSDAHDAWRLHQGKACHWTRHSIEDQMPRAVYAL